MPHCSREQIRLMTCHHDLFYSLLTAGFSTLFLSRLLALSFFLSISSLSSSSSRSLRNFLALSYSSDDLSPTSLRRRLKSQDSPHASNYLQSVVCLSLWLILGILFFYLLRFTQFVLFGLLFMFFCPFISLNQFYDILPQLILS